MSEHTGTESFDADNLASSTDLIEAWIQCLGNQSAMAKLLGCHRNTIRNRINQLTDSLSRETDKADVFKSRLLAHLLLKPAPSAQQNQETK
jgi:DNA-binding PucR family transcriptional regulator